MKMRFGEFLGFDIAGASLYTLAYGAIGFLFRDFLAAITRSFQTAGHVGEIVILAAACVFVAYRLWLYWKNRVYRIVPRVQVTELATKLQSEELGQILLADVRSHGYYDGGAARIRGSIRIEPNNFSEEVSKLPRDKDIYLYCT